MAAAGCLRCELADDDAGDVSGCRAAAESLPWLLPRRLAGVWLWRRVLGCRGRWSLLPLEAEFSRLCEGREAILSVTSRPREASGWVGIVLRRRRRLRRSKGRTRYGV